MSNNSIDFNAVLADTLAALDVGPHCSCAEITAEILSKALPLEGTSLRFVAAGFGGGIGGNGSLCGAFAAGLMAIGAARATQDGPEGCISELIIDDIQTYYDGWVEAHGSVRCADLSGYPLLRDDANRNEFQSSGGPERCTNNYIRFAVERTLDMVAAKKEDVAH